MKKRTVAALLIAGLLASAFGCTGKDNNTAERELSLRDLDMSKYVTLSEYKGLSTAKADTTVTADEIQEKVDILVKNNLDVIGVTDRAAENGDKVVCDLRCYVDDIAVSSAQSLGEVFVVGDGDIRSEVDKGVVGMMPGDSKKINVKFEDDYFVSELAGKNAILLVKLNYIFPDKLTDDMVSKMSNKMYSTVDQMENYVKSSLETTKVNDAKQEEQYNLLQSVIDNSEFSELPKEYTEDQIDKLNDKYSYQCGLAGITTEEYIENVYGLTMEELATNYLHQRMAIEAIAQKEGIGYTDESYNAEIQKKADEQGISVEYYFLLNNVVNNEDYVEKLTFDKVITIIYDNAVIQ